ncbi:hypothetical protein [Schlesneria sp. T3-172]|uniref:hypothetical protein n=1 Tax=Schlesneria sphaerica TaxID=3373610 RepID=UPI0037CB05A6
MISIPRSLIHQFRAVTRRAGLCKPGTRQSGSVRILASTDTVQLQTTNGTVSAELKASGQFGPAEVTVPAEFLADCEAKNPDLVTIRRNGNDRILVTWTDRGIPQQRDYEVTEDLEMPALAPQLAANSPKLLAALRDAMSTTESNSTRYALDCLQLDGSSGSIAATDSRQLLVQSGFQFPWSEKLLIPSTKLYGCRELPTDLAVEIGRTDQGVTVKIGCWTIHHTIVADRQFPEIARAIPVVSAIRTRLSIPEADAKFLAETADRLPADDQSERPVTLELNGSVVVRARKDNQSPLMELLLNRSERRGDQMRLQTNRGYLLRALEMGFREIGFAGPDAACLCQDETRSYVWMLLENKGALETDPEAIRLESSAIRTRAEVANDQQTIQSVTTGSTINPPINRVKRLLHKKDAKSGAGGSRCNPDPAVVVPIDTFQQVIDLRDQLQILLRSVSSLAKQIRQERKQSLLVQSTLRSLQQLRLLDA